MKPDGGKGEEVCDGEMKFGRCDGLEVRGQRC